MITHNNDTELCRIANLVVSPILTANAEFSEIYQITFDDHAQVTCVFKAKDLFILSAILSRMVGNFNNRIEFEEDIKVKVVSYTLRMYQRELHLDFRLE